MALTFVIIIIMCIGMISSRHEPIMANVLLVSRKFGGNKFDRFASTGVNVNLAYFNLTDSGSRHIVHNVMI